MCVVFLLFDEKAPDSAPKIFKFRPADALALAWCSWVSRARVCWEEFWTAWEEEEVDLETWFGDMMNFI